MFLYTSFLYLKRVVLVFFLLEQFHIRTIMRLKNAKNNLEAGMAEFQIILVNFFKKSERDIFE